MLAALDLPPSILAGDYHIQDASPAVDAGATGKALPSNPTTIIAAPAFDFDNDARLAPIDIGADEITPALPTLGLLDDFNRANASNLGANWSPSSGTQAIRVNNNQAWANSAGQAIWNVPSTGFGANQGAAFTFANTTVNNAALFLKATGGTATAPASYIRVQYQTTNGGQVVVATTVDSGATYIQRGTIAATFGVGDTLAALAYADGSVNVFRNGKFIGRVTGTTFTGTGRIGIQLLTSGTTGTRVDNFSGGTLP
jgi:hypothetical protein